MRILETILIITSSITLILSIVTLHSVNKAEKELDEEFRRVAARKNAENEGV